MNTTTTKEVEMVKKFNEEHSDGKIVVNTNKGKIKTYAGKAYIGKGNKAKIFLKNPKGHYSLEKIIKEEKINLPKKENKEIKLFEYADPKYKYYKLKDYIFKQLQSKEEVEITKISVEIIFSNITTNWGLIRSVENFKIFIERYGMKISYIDETKIVIKKA